MISDCNGVLVGLSGGADSVSLLHLMRKICEERGINLRAVHINHGIRGEAALQDELFCRNLCENLNIPLDVYRFDIPALAESKGIGLEECGRIYRYRCFEAISKQYNYRTATAHTLSDSVETMLLNISRGCGITGLRGIPAVRGKIIRPLILASRDDIERYCADNNLEYVTDQSNFDDNYRRNHIRLNIVPEFVHMNPSFLSAAQRLMECAQMDSEFIESEVDKVYEHISYGGVMWKAKELNTLNEPIKNRVIIRMVEEITGNPPDFTHINLVKDMINKGRGAVSLSSGYNLHLNSGILYAQVETANTSEWCMPIADDIFLPNGKRMRLKEIDYADFMNLAKNDKSLFKSAIRYDIINQYVNIRNRRAGDRFTPAKRGVTKTLKKLFNEAHIEPNIRGKLCILEQNSKIIWIEGFGPAQGFEPSPDCKSVFLINLF